MALTEAAIRSRGLIPAAPIRRLIEQWSRTEVDVRELLGPRTAGNCLGNTGKIAELTELNVEFIKELRGGRKEWIEFDNADKIVSRLGYGWGANEELQAIYQGFDLKALDKRKPLVGFVKRVLA